MARAFIFIGRSGCGKGTQAQLLIEQLNRVEPGRKVIYWETGKHLRQFSGEAGYTNKLAKETIDGGGRLPDFLAVWTWSQGLIDNYTGQETLVFDGITRSLVEAQMFSTIFNLYSDLQPIIILLNISRETAEARLAKRGRNDDAQSGVAKRLDWFDQDVVPALDYFRTNPTYQFWDIDGEPSVEEIHQDIVSRL